jgi:hypothetical protein
MNFNRRGTGTRFSRFLSRRGSERVIARVSMQSTGSSEIASLIYRIVVHISYSIRNTNKNKST